MNTLSADALGARSSSHVSCLAFPVVVRFDKPREHGITVVGSCAAVRLCWTEDNVCCEREVAFTERFSDGECLAVFGPTVGALAARELPKRLKREAVTRGSYSTVKIQDDIDTMCLERSAECKSYPPEFRYVFALH